MPEPVIRLPLTTRPSHNVLRDCKWKIRTFVERDAYVGYDYGCGIALRPSDIISEDQVRGMHCEMRGRSSNKSWSHFTDRPLAELQEIPQELDLEEADDPEVKAGHDALARLVRGIVAKPRLTDVSVSKVLHLMRPRFVAISDDYVRGCLGIGDYCTDDRLERLHTLMAVQRGIRRLARDNMDALEELAAYADSLPPVRLSIGKFAGKEVPILLTRVRILDIVLWTDVAIHDGHHPKWNRWYAEEVAANGR
jgi:hypothetical protein